MENSLYKMPISANVVLDSGKVSDVNIDYTYIDTDELAEFFIIKFWKANGRKGEKNNRLSGEDSDG